MEEWLESLQKAVPLLQQAVSVNEIKKGHSADKKYRVDLPEGRTVVLRVASEQQAEQKAQEFAVLQSLASYPIRASKPLAFGVQKELGICYMLVSYIEGDDARDRLPFYTESEQQQTGFLAGQDLAAMHQLAAPAAIPPWIDRCVQKHRRYVEAYQTFSPPLPYGDKILAYIERHLACLEGRPNQFLHDDFHVGNLIVRDGTYAGVIDFNRYDWGDPVHEFVKLVFFSKEVSVPFCNGQLAGYWNHQEIPDEFWTLFNVYTAMTVFSSIIWTKRVVPEQLPDMIARVNLIVEEYDAFERRTPHWYKRIEK